jgi:hypothetical protein
VIVENDGPELYDLIVVGAGMAGLTAAAIAVDKGAQVLVLERSREVGGNAAVSGGYLWTLRSEEQLRQSSPKADPALQQALFSAFPDVVEWLRRRGVSMSAPVTVMRHGRGYLLDISSHLAACVKSIESRGGAIAREVEVTGLVVDGSVVRGVRIHSEGGDVEVRGAQTVLATGGFHGDPDLRENYLGVGGRELRLRSNPYSRGDGLRLALAVGGIFTAGNEGFYGHLMPTGVPLDDLSQIRNVSLFHSEHGLLLDRLGHRFTDESLGDEISNQALFRAGGEALLVWDNYIQQEIVLKPYPPGSPGEDRFDLVRKRGGFAAVADSPPELADAAAAWGWQADGVIDTMACYNSVVETAPERLSPTRAWNARRLSQPPFYAVRCGTSVTFAHGGIRIDAHARALREDGTPIPGLLVAGSDSGDVMRDGYSGGLSQAAAFALIACRTAGFQ